MQKRNKSPFFPFTGYMSAGLVLATLFVSGCVPDIAPQVEVPVVSTEEMLTGPSVLTGRLIAVVVLNRDNYASNRQDRNFDAVDQDEVQIVKAGPNAYNAVSSALADVIRRKGGTVTTNSDRTPYHDLSVRRSFLNREPLKITGIIEKWQVAVEPSVPGFALTGEAELVLSLTNKTDEVFRSYYRGKVESVDAYPRASRLRGILRKAMTLALEEAVLDNGLVTAINNSGL